MCAQAGTSQILISAERYYHYRDSKLHNYRQPHVCFAHAQCTMRHVGLARPSVQTDWKAV